jgi:hypothetical protein
VLFHEFFCESDSENWKSNILMSMDLTELNRMKMELKFIDESGVFNLFYLYLFQNRVQEACWVET